MRKILNCLIESGTAYIYVLDTESQNVALTLLPERYLSEYQPDENNRLTNLIQIKLVGDPYATNYTMGRTMKNSQSTFDLKYEKQEVIETEGSREIVTTLKSARVEARHRLVLQDGAPYAKSLTEIVNTSDCVQKIEMLSSFALSGIPALGEEERMRDLYLWRLQSRWASEGKLRSDSFVDLHLEPTWLDNSATSERYGQVGSMPVRGWFPWGVVEDRKYGYSIGAMIYHGGSWQMEVYAFDRKTEFSGGLADREFGHFMKDLKPGETFKAPKAVIACRLGDVDVISQALVASEEEACVNFPECEQDLPIVFNEYCTTWGNPTEENITQIVHKLKGMGFKYLVIDCGWYSLGDEGWFNDQGDWNVNQKRFPEGMKKISKMIREAGMIPGIWFELENVGFTTELYKKEEWMLHRDGVVLQDGTKRFLDMTNPDVIEYLDQKVIDMLRDNDFGYIKVDYNGEYGLGADGAESLGEKLRQCTDASRGFFDRMREQIPGLVVENCASGGHRLEPSFMAASSMASFSDAHECNQIPVIAASLHRAILPRQSQIWAVMHASDSIRRVYYSMINTFLGRMCLSGEIYELQDEQWSVIRNGMDFYKKAAPIIRNGRTEIIRDERMDYSHMKGLQAVKRFGTKDAEGSLLLTAHMFEDPLKEAVIEIPDGYAVEETYGEDMISIHLEKRAVGQALILKGMQEFSAYAVLLKAVNNNR